ncbi:hypothetical protein [Paenibacillus sp. J22TS3]|uniref:hypothetical protein n=1 Tax=Paenibacillus sp. J22TS3 TaxID=2807192 RepID=UPI001B130ACF|nr:hypothetical protein [Paenibacillus sp. J22TS3]GIP23960.1 hypothetical protein J22TS3_42350 [Paenibacillus sp. J22TS3]
MIRTGFASKNVRWISHSLIALTLSLSAGTFVSAEETQLGAATVVWDKDVALASDSIYEHGPNEILAASVQSDQVNISSVNSSGIKKSKLSFNKHSLGFLASFHQTNGGGYISVGGASVLKVNAQGGKDWEYSITKPNTYLASVDQLNNGNYITVGTTPGLNGDKDQILTKFSGNGTVIWQKTWNKPTEDSVSRVKHTADGGFVLVGESYEAGTNNTNIVISKYTNTSKLEWEKTLVPSQDSQNLWTTGIIQDSDGYVLTGYYNHPNPDGGVRYLTTGFVLKTDMAGNLTWSKPLASQWDRSQVNDIALDSDGGYLITGKVNEDWHGTISKEYVAHLDSAGTTQWETIVNRTNSINRGAAVQPIQGGVLAIGSADQTVKATKLTIGQ